MTRQAILDLARREIGTAEEPAGSNCVKYNTSYYGRAVSGGSYPWCCVFLWWLFQSSGEPELFYGGGKTASCGTLASYAKKNKLLTSGDYRPGDLVFFRFSGKAIQHVASHSGGSQCWPTSSVRPGNCSVFFADINQS